MPRKTSRKATSKSSTKKRTTKSAKRRTTVPKSAAKTKRKVGGSAKAAKSFASKRDFGVSRSDRGAQMAASKQAKSHPAGERNPGQELPRAGVESREAGVGGQEAGAGSYSGGDLDVTVIGVGDGGASIAQSGPDEGASDNLAQPNP